MRPTGATRLASAVVMAAVLLSAQPISATIKTQQIPGLLLDVSVVSSTDAWAVGFEDDGARTLIAHRDGGTWSQVNSPNPGLEVNELFAVEAISPDNVWAVGRYGDDGSGSEPSYTLIEHYDGSAWSVIDGPLVGGLQVALFSVSATGPNDVWAVGSVGFKDAIVEHWNGTRWRVVSYGAPSDLRGVTAFASDDAWAVGREGRVGHWDGSTWTVVKSGLGESLDIGGTATSDLWTVGAGLHASPVFHWDGSRWTAVDVPHRKGYNFTLNGVMAMSPTDGWAVGYKHRFQHHADRTVPRIKHWNGSSWSSSPLPPSLDGVVLESVDGASSNDVWAVGGTVGRGAVIFHWDGNQWSRIV